MTAMFEKFGPISPGHLSPGAEGQKPLFGTDFELWPKRNSAFCNGTWYQQWEKFVNLQRLPYMPPNLVNFGPETTENGWRVFAHG